MGYFLFLVLFFLSGAAGLVYETVWVRQFAQVLGTSTYAVTIVLSSFMCGLGLGSWLLGRVADRTSGRGLVGLYVGIEVGIAVYALLLPFLIQGMESLFVFFSRSLDPGFWLFNGVRLGMAFILLLIPTVFIGGTLPVLSRLIIRDNRKIGVSVSQLFGANTLGAIFGVMLAGYAVLPFWGIAASTYIAVGLNLFVAGGIWLTYRKVRFISPQKKSRTCDSLEITVTGRQQWAVIFGFGLSGVAAMIYEVAWTRTLILIVGTTTYAFTTMLAVILLGLGVGSLLYPLVPKRISRLKLFSVLQLIIAVSVFLGLPCFEKLPLVYLSFSEYLAESWILLQVFRFIMAGLVMIVPTTALGMLFPTVSAIFVQNTGHLGSRVGKAYAFNTFGAAAGAALGGLCLIPLIGMEKALMTGALLNLSAAVFVLVLLSAPLSRRFVYVGCASFLCLALWLLVPAWSPKVMNSGAYVYAPRYMRMLDDYSRAARKSEKLPRLSDWRVWEMAMRQYKLLYYRTGLTSTVAVMQRPDGVRFLTIDGKTDASNGYKSDMHTQVMIGQLPMLFHENPQEVLVIGLGSGVTAGSVLTHPVREVDCVEISPAVVKAASYFSRDNHNVLEDKRLDIIRRDARNFMLTSEKKYDVVISQPSNPWVSGEANLFTLQWYREVKERLQSGGILVQWLPTYFMSEKDLKIVLHTMRRIFPNVSLWTSGAVGDVVLMARKGKKMHVDYNNFLEKIQQIDVAQDINRLGVNPEYLPFELFVMNKKGLINYLYTENEHPLYTNTDDLLYTEFATPKRMVANRKVVKFMKPENLHGNIVGLEEIIFGYNEEKMFSKDL